MARSSAQIKSQMEEIHKKNLDPTKPMRHSKKKKWERTKSTAENMIKKKKNCPAKEKKCWKINHFALACRTKTNTRQTANKEKKYFLRELTETELTEPWCIKVQKIHKTTVRFKIDIGTDINIMSTETYKNLSQNIFLNQRMAPSPVLEE